MPRMRNIKPDFFKDEDLSYLPFEARIIFAGLLCLADREGRLEYRPKRIKVEIMPFDDVDIDTICRRLADPKMDEIREYRRAKLERAIAARIAQAKGK